MTIINKLNLSKTCSRFCKLINKQKQIVRFLSYSREILHCQFIAFYSFRQFVSNFKSKFYSRFVNKTDQLYLNYVLEMFCNITAENVLAHFLWCTRNKFLFDCDLCVKVEQFYKDMPDQFVCKKFYYELWNKNLEQVFNDRYCYQGVLVRQHCVCDNIENICSTAVFMSFYGAIAIRIFFNIAKKFIFGVRLRNKEIFFAFFSEQSKIVFISLCDDLDANVIAKFIRKLKPCIDYNSRFTKIPNKHYIDYLECL